MSDAGDRVPAGYRDVTRRAVLQDARTLAGFALVVLAGVLAAGVASRTASGLAADLRRAFEGVPAGIATIVLGLLLAGYLVLVVATPVWLLLRGRFGLLGRGALGAATGVALFALVTRVPSVRALGQSVEQALHHVGSAPQAWELAAFAAVTAVVRPALSPRWSRVLWTMLVLLALARVVSTSVGPVEVTLAVGVGGVGGSALLLVLGRSVPELTEHGVRDVLAGAGVSVSQAHRAVGTGWTFRATGTDGTDLDVRVLDDRDWQADRLRRGYRRLRLRGMGDDAPSASPVQAVSAEALAGLLAAAHGVAVPAVRAVARGAQDEAVLAVERPAGRLMDELDEHELTHEVLVAAWRQVGVLAASRVAVHALDLGHLLLTPTGQVLIVDLSSAEVAADDGVLAADVAELLAASSAVVGADRAVAAALDGRGRDALEPALSRLVPAALSPRTRTAVRARPDGLSTLVARVASATGVDEPQFEKVERFTPRTLLLAGMVAVAVYLLAPQLADLPALATQVRGADWRWLVPVAAASLITYVGAGLGLASSTPGRVSAVQAAAVALASSFVATFAPPGVGQVGLNVRFLQKRGYPTALAASASAAKEAAVVVGHLLLLTGFAVWAGNSGAVAAELNKLPSLTLVLAVAAVAAALVGAAFAVPRVRRAARERLVPAIRSSADAMRTVAGNPGKLAALLGGVILLPLGYAACLYFSVRAFGVPAPFVTVALVSLTAGTVATAAPWPGGVGAVEAVLLAALTGVGVAATPALAAVVLYRLATFWLPIAPGAVAFRMLTARDVL